MRSRRSPTSLTHRDTWLTQVVAQEFGSKRFIHKLELSSQPDAEVVLEGNEPVELATDLLAIPTPGHTAGHCVLLFDQQFLFTGDHLDYDRHTLRLTASVDYCWHSWPQQIESMHRLSQYSFEWVLPGHGQKVKLSRERMRQEMIELVERMRAGDFWPRTWGGIPLARQGVQLRLVL